MEIRALANGVLRELEARGYAERYALSNLIRIIF